MQLTLVLMRLEKSELLAKRKVNLSGSLNIGAKSSAFINEVQ